MRVIPASCTVLRYCLRPRYARPMLQSFALTLGALHGQVPEPGEDFGGLDERVTVARGLDHEQFAPLVRYENGRGRDAGIGSGFVRERRSDAAVPFIDPCLFVRESVEIRAARVTFPVHGDEHGCRAAGTSQRNRSAAV